MDKTKKPVKRNWHKQEEIILKNWGEASGCYRYMHYRAYEKYQKSSMRFTLPIIIISTITGTANFAQETFPTSVRPFVPAAIGGMNLFAAILTTVLQFLKINELTESHRQSSISYGKLSRHIRLELNLPIYERSLDGIDMVNQCKSEYDRLIEQSPPLPKSVVNIFQKKFPDQKPSEKFIKLYRPYEVTGVTSINPYENDKEIESASKVISNMKKRVIESKQVDKSEASSQKVLRELVALKQKKLVSEKDEFFDVENNTCLEQEPTEIVIHTTDDDESKD